MVLEKASESKNETGAQALPPPPPKPAVVRAFLPIPPPPTARSDVQGTHLPLPPPPPPKPADTVTQSPLPPPPPAQPDGPSTEPAPAATQPAGTGADLPAPASPEPPLSPPAADVPQVAERKLREYRYRTRILKATLLPIIFSVMSVLMLYNYVTEFEPYFGWDLQIIIAGFAIGFIVMGGLVVTNMRRAKRAGAYSAKQWYGAVIILAFVVPYAYFILFVNPSSAWRFSIGYFLSALLTPLVVVSYEAFADGKFYIEEEDVDDRLTRTLVFRH
jgi:hypothetical protein